ncbi:MAG: hypothetical protein IJ437_07750 [Clostridia bacterium]|nr:hypothetical protein [Clostridia bacterium]
MFFIKLQSKIESSLTKREIVQRLCKITNTTVKDDDIFVGQISDDEFRIHKRPKENVRNAFTPVLIGKIESKNEGCDINVTARLNMFASIFFLIWSIGAIIVPLIIGIIEPIFLLASLGFAIVITLLILLAFYKPAKNTIALLNSILRK